MSEHKKNLTAVNTAEKICQKGSCYMVLWGVFGPEDVKDISLKSEKKF